MSFDLDFNLDEVSDSEFSLIPAGTHRAAVVAVNYVDGYNGEGKDLQVRLSFLDDDLKNRMMTAFLNLHNSQDWKQAKGRYMLKTLVAASGIEGFSNYAQLVSGTPIGVVVKHWKNKNTGVVKDQVGGFTDPPAVDGSVAKDTPWDDPTPSF